MLSMKRSRGGYYYILLGEDRIHAGLSKEEATSFMHTYHKIWEAGQEFGRESRRMDTELNSSEFCPEGMPIIKIDMSKVKQYKAMDELTEQAQELGLYEIDLLTVCGTFDTKDCISVEDLTKLLKTEK